MEIQIHCGDILDLDVEAIVYPGNSLGTMEDEYGISLIEQEGEHLEEEAVDTAPIAVGAAVVSGAEGLRAEHVIHSPVMPASGERITVENVRRCTRASLVAARVRGFSEVAIPAIHPNTDDMSLAETARAMLDELRAFRHDDLRVVYIVDEDRDVIDTFIRCLESVR